MFAYHIQLTDDDFIEYRLCLNYTTPACRKKMMMQRYLCPILFILWAIFLGYLKGHSLIVYALTAVLSIGWIVFFEKLIVRNMRKSIKSVKETGKAPYTEDSQDLFHEDEFARITKNAETIISYSAIEKIIAGRNALYLHRNNTMTPIILPYRIFASEEERKAFLQFIKQKTNAAVIAGVTK